MAWPETKAAVDIIIPHYGAGELTQLCIDCLQSIKLFTEDYRLIFVDNASPEFDYVVGALENHPHVLIRETENVGVTRAVNHGLAVSTAPHVVLLNNDTLAVEDWIQKLQLGFSKFPRVGLAGPLTTTPQSWQGVWQCTPPVPGMRTPPSVHILGRGRMLAFFCVMMSRAVIDTVGPLDESYGVGFGDDDAYCRSVQRAGFDLALIQTLRIPHRHRSTFQALYSKETLAEMQRVAMAKFQAEK